jgi:hypothetical protein
VSVLTLGILTDLNESSLKIIQALLMLVGIQTRKHIGTCCPLAENTSKQMFCPLGGNYDTLFDANLASKNL